MTLSRTAGLVFLFVALPSIAQRLSGAKFSHAQYHLGDDILWAQPDFDDSQWPALADFPPDETYRGALWIRFNITVKRKQDPRPRALMMVAIANYQVFWDGQFLGGNGIVSEEAGREQPGRIYAFLPVPETLDTPGVHKVALRISNHHGDGRLRLLMLRFGVLDQMIHETRIALLPLALLSSFLVVGLFFLFYGRVERRQSALRIFGVLCCTVGVLYFLEYLKILGYPYHFYKPRMIAINVLTMLVNFMLPYFFVRRYNLPRPSLWMFLFLTMAFAVWVWGPGSDGRNMGFYLIGSLFSFCATIWAVFTKREHAWFGLMGVLIVIAGLYFTRSDFVEHYFYTSFLVLMLLMLASTGFQVRDLRRRHERSQVESARLESELLRRHLQPHFTMNTLTAILEWIEEDPKTAGLLIEKLAEEMKTLGRIAGKKLIPLAEELALCNAHLKIMSLRKDWRLSLETNTHVPDAYLPPALLHTLIENGITHADGAMPEFFLCAEIKERRLELTLITRGTRAEDGDLDGGGSKYIRARLEEAFPGEWRFVGRRVANGWETSISMPYAESEA